MSDAPGAINFTMFLTLFGERLQGTDPEDVIRNAFGCFDEENQVRLSTTTLQLFEFVAPGNANWGKVVQLTST
jgi:Ca2+-binding EF-hand superfamily protein